MILVAIVIFKLRSINALELESFSNDPLNVRKDGVETVAIVHLGVSLQAGRLDFQLDAFYRDCSVL